MQGLSQWVGRSLTCVDMSRITRSGIGGVDVSDIIKSDKRAPVVRNLPSTLIPKYTCNIWMAG